MIADSFRKELSIAAVMLGLVDVSEKGKRRQCFGLKVVQKWYGFSQGVL